ncbi:MAG: aminoacetone oxidase family FAD-binding enzyme, partial [Deltaproteobacteria bacterium]|nr:aminoacetone oxidase family FAD-binding enzyme [Deltaproteobacteria bacterium]
VEIKPGHTVKNISKINEQFQLKTHQEEYACSALVIATGGLSIPKLGATAFGYEIAKQFELKIVPTRAALDGFILNPSEIDFFSTLSGISLDCVVSCNGEKFRENILFTHRGLSGPAALQASLYWNPGDPLEIDLLPNLNSHEWLLKNKRAKPRLEIKNLLSEVWPERFAEFFCTYQDLVHKPLQEIKDKELEAFSKNIHAWKLRPLETVGYSKAEVTRGGVDTDELSSKTMEAKKVPGLYFIGEVVDVTGQLGGYNFQWAWASGWAAGQVV